VQCTSDQYISWRLQGKLVLTLRDIHSTVGPQTVQCVMDFLTKLSEPRGGFAVKLLDVKALSAALALAGLMTASAHVNAEINMKVFVDGELALPVEVTFDKREQTSLAKQGGVLVCQDYNRDGIITFDECTFTEE
jgi:hypothetical protein